MKTLDVRALHHAIDQTLEQLKKQSEEIAKVKKSVNGITALDDALKGKGGDAIRAFYEECHTPFLRFYESFIEEYQSSLKKMKNALNSLEPNHNGYISQAFIDHDLEQGLNAADRTTKHLVSKANAAISKVSHIVDLPDLNDNDFHEQNQKAKKEISSTLEKLHAFDREQTNALKTAEQDLETMHKYITQLEKMYTGPKIEITGYKKGSILKPDENTNINGPAVGLKGELENAELSPMEIMLKKLSDQEETEVDSLAKADHSKKIDTGIRVINGKVYNMKGYKKLGSVDVTDEIGTGKDFVGGSYSLYSNGQIVRKYISGGEVKYELVSRIPENKVKKSDIEKAFDWAKDTAGELSGGYDGYRAITGVDPVTGEKLSVTDRILAGVSVIPATKAVKIGKYVFKATKGAKTAKKVSTVEKGVKSTGNSEKIHGVKDYIKDVESITGRKIPDNQRALLKKELRENDYSNKLPREEVMKHRQDFQRKKDGLIDEWEKNTGQKWPTYSEPILSKRGRVYIQKGDKYDAHHVIKNEHGGPNEWYNIHPAKRPDEHQSGIHRKDGPEKRLFK
ncbi:T7SS effector LXG polymorphic toxin [Bacillus sonorensis]|uniref:Transposase protein n=3 Tax=Bacillus sonorensis TaxID=119858 RepID=M5NZG1_9BACI|nr:MULTISPECIES: T7SS effector LXG polymorphic toxin [Bacillus]ASB91369.1 Ribonuclease YxiD [Bacillus sonorensis]EME72594.1 transposase protein [Bacillus sonorensis L12]MCZ0074286.1 T7SS effector LXG polymorphic toxin [Bacillus sonorensis]MCZ0092908.1 T7SS effector LXG polymorphic toxin [Bacillus sonorensis]MEC0342319.1 T7SS effector LXG polymorphic toxin [Bacillus sonorensis]